MVEVGEDEKLYTLLMHQHGHCRDGVDVESISMFMIRCCHYDTSQSGSVSHLSTLPI